MTNNNPSQYDKVKKLTDEAAEKLHKKDDEVMDRFFNPSQQERCPTCRGLGMFAGVACPTINYHQSPAEVSQPEGWEKEFDERFPEGKECSVKGCNGHCLYGFQAKSFIRSTLSTLVKEMGKKKRDEAFYQDASPIQNKITEGNILFNAGISAAQEVVKKMV